MLLASKYSGAWAEICARIQARQQVNLLFAAALMSLFLVVFSKSYEESQSIKYIIPLLSVLITWAYCLWIASHERIIGLLSQFIVSIEHYEYNKNNAEKKEAVLCETPSFHSNYQLYYKKALRHRNLTDVATSICIFISAMPSFYIGIMSYYNTENCHFIVYCFFCCVVCLSGMVFVLFNGRMRQNPAKSSSDR